MSMSRRSGIGTSRVPRLFTLLLAMSILAGIGPNTNAELVFLGATGNLSASGNVGGNRAPSVGVDGELPLVLDPTMLVAYGTEIGTVSGSALAFASPSAIGLGFEATVTNVRTLDDSDLTLSIRTGMGYRTVPHPNVQTYYYLDGGTHFEGYVAPGDYVDLFVGVAGTLGVFPTNNVGYYPSIDGFNRHISTPGAFSVDFVLDTQFVGTDMSYDGAFSGTLIVNLDVYIHHNGSAIPDESSYVHIYPLISIYNPMLVPEPSTLALASIGLTAGLGIWWRQCERTA